MVVCAEDEEIVSVVEKNAGRAILTGNHHKNGTERIYEGLQKLGINNVDYVISVQGDEPAINPEDIKKAKVTLSELCEDEERNPDEIQITIHSLPCDKDTVDMFEDVEVDRVLVRVTSLTASEIFNELEGIAEVVLV